MTVPFPDSPQSSTHVTFALNHRVELHHYHLPTNLPARRTAASLVPHREKRLPIAVAAGEGEGEGEGGIFLHGRKESEEDTRGAKIHIPPSSSHLLSSTRRVPRFHDDLPARPCT